MANKKIFVSGCYDMLHSGHVAFFKEVATYGDLYVGLGSDKTIRDLKGRETINSEQERLYMVKSIKHVTDAFVSRGGGFLDFEEDLRDLKPDMFIVNEDGNSSVKAALCKELGIEYKVLARIPEAGLPARSTTSLRTGDNCLLPYRLDLAGTWIDQPYVSKFKAGWAITISLEPIIEYNERSGMSTSTRNAAKEIWPYQLPLEKPEKLAEMLFRYENKPGNDCISGAQDSIGICVPGITRHFYDNVYWPTAIENISDEATISWLENHLRIITLWPRPDGLDLLKETYVNLENVTKLSNSADKAWRGIQTKDLSLLAEGFRESFEAQITMFPAMVNDRIDAVIDTYRDKALAWKLSGAGGGGYLVLLTEQVIEGSMAVSIRRGGM